MNSIEELYKIYLQNPSISTDSRSIFPQSIFFSLKGPSFNGNLFAEAALEKGAAFAVVDEEQYRKDERYLLFSNALQALQDLAAVHRSKLNIPVLAVTGSNGKTTTKELVKIVLSKKYKTLATKGNLNNHIGVPLTILSISGDIEFAVIEMGANHKKEIESYCKIAKPDYGLITNVGKAHLEGFGGFEGVKKGKAELYEWIAESGKNIFINGDNIFLKEMSAVVQQNKLIKYGTSPECYCSGKLIDVNPALEVSWKCKEANSNLRSNLIGEYNFENILSAICIGNYFGVKEAEINSAIESYIPDNSRSQVIIKGTNSIILDAYNANPTSMEAALKNFLLTSNPHKIIFIGDMAELGEESESEHRRIAGIIKKNPFEEIILVGKNFKMFADELEALHFENSETAAKWLKENPVENKSILIKGSRSTKMERILEGF